MLDVVKSMVEEIGEQKDRFLVSCFFQQDVWKVDYYSLEKHKIYTYTRQNQVLVMQEDDIFQKKEKPLEKLDLDKVTVSLHDAVEKIPFDSNKVISILQVIDGNIVWNLSAVTPTLELYNVKVDAISGEVLSEKKESFLNFRMPQKESS